MSLYEDKLKIVDINKKIDKLEYKKQLLEYNKEFLNETISISEEKLDAKEEKRIKRIEERQIRRKERLVKRAEAKIRHRKMNEPPHLSVLEEVGNAVTHGVGAILAIVAMIVLLIKSDTSLKVTATLVYTISMFFMMLASCLYHSFKSRSTVKRIFRRFDYSSIYLLIGGTFAPFLLVYWGQMGGWRATTGIVIFIVQWVLIITGITMVGVFGPGRLRWLHYPLYFAIGWSGLIFLPDFIKNDLPLLFWILGGGVTYTLGMIPFVKRGVPAAHFIWHFFVLAGAAVHFVGILLYIY